MLLVDIEKIRLMIENELPELSKEDKEHLFTSIKSFTDGRDFSDVETFGMSPERFIVKGAESYIRMDKTKIHERCYEFCTRLLNFKK